ncbi:MAG: NAD(P)/FAD-dependent oxidoreductase [Acidobacteriota bacterium]
MTAPARWDVVVIGGGVNGLVCAALLAKDGRRTLVLEARDEPGGCALTREIAPGFRAPALAHATGPLRRDVVDALQLAAHGLSVVTTDVDMTALAPDGRALVVYHDAARTADGLRAWSARDAEAWPRYVQSRAALGGVIGSLFGVAPPSVDEPSARDLWHLLRTLRAFRALDKADAYRLLRWGPMAAADLVAESFETDLLQAALAADGIFGAMMGPWSAGSGMQMLLAAANEAVGATGSRFVRGGPGALVSALTAALRQAGGDVRTGAPVARVLVADERARGVALASGEEIAARIVVSAVDPKRTFLQLCDPMDLAPEFLWRMRNYRVRGTLAKVNLALSGLPAFTGVAPDALQGRVRIGPTIDYLKRAYDHAKYGRWSPEPWMEFTLPTLLDPSLAPEGGHVLSAYVQFAPYALRDTTWEREREALGDVAVATLERYVPGLRSRIVARDVLTPLDFEREWGLTGGHIFHGELALDQFFTMRPLLGWGQYASPIRGLHLCGSGTHPGTGLTGGSGANAARAIAAAL